MKLTDPAPAMLPSASNETLVSANFPSNAPSELHCRGHVSVYQGNVLFGDALRFKEQSHRPCGFLVLAKDDPAAGSEIQTMTRKMRAFESSDMVR